MEQFLASYGYPAFFALSFLASTLIPIGSEWLLAVMLMNGHEPVMTGAVATLGNTLGALTTWASPLCLVGGILKVGFGRFTLLVFTGKLVRYAAVAWLTLGGDADARRLLKKAHLRRCAANLIARRI
jgi:membrane protein YqaA with SNARE-associated domain